MFRKLISASATAILAVASAQVMLGLIGTVYLYFSPDWRFSTYGIFLLQQIVLIICSILLLSSGSKDSRSFNFGMVGLLSASAFAKSGIEQLYFTYEYLAFRIAYTLPLDALFPVYLWRFVRQFPQAFISSRLNKFLNSCEIFVLALGLILIIANIGRNFFVDSQFIELLSSRNTQGIYAATIYGIAIPALFVLIYRMRTARENEKAKVRVLVTGLVISLTPPLIFIFVTSLSSAAAQYVLQDNVSILIFPLMQLLLIGAPVVTTYTLLVERVLPIRVIVSQTLRFTIGKLAIGILIAAPIGLLTYYLYQSRALTVSSLVYTSNGFYLLIALAMTIYLLSQRKLAILYLESLLDRASYDSSSLLMQLSEKMSSAESLRELCNCIEDVLNQSIKPTNIYFMFNSKDSFLHDPQNKLDSVKCESTLGSTLALGSITDVGIEMPTPFNDQEARWISQANIALSVPISRQGRTIGIILLSSKKSELPFSITDRNFLLLISNAFGQRINDSTEPNLLNNSNIDGYCCKSCASISDSSTECKTCGNTEFDWIPLPKILHDHYLLLSAMGGGMSKVFLAEDVILHRKVVLKTVLNATAAELRYLRDEAKLIAGMEHENIARIYGFESYKSQPVLVFEYLEGGTLERPTSPGQLSRNQLYSLVASIAKALSYLHSKGVVHGDVKPANIGLDKNGKPKLLDFGLSQILSSDPMMQGSGREFAGGTYAYMSYERLTTGILDPMTDLWALAVTYYELLHGIKLFEAATVDEIISKIRSVNENSMELPNSKFFKSALSLTVSNRPQTAESFVQLMSRDNYLVSERLTD